MAYQDNTNPHANKQTANSIAQGWQQAQLRQVRGESAPQNNSTNQGVRGGQTQSSSYNQPMQTQQQSYGAGSSYSGAGYFTNLYQQYTDPNVYAQLYKNHGNKATVNYDMKFYGVMSELEKAGFEINPEQFPMIQQRINLAMSYEDIMQNFGKKEYRAAQDEAYFYMNQSGEWDAIQQIAKLYSKHPKAEDVFKDHPYAAELFQYDEYDDEDKLREQLGIVPKTFNWQSMDEARAKKPDLDSYINSTEMFAAGLEQYTALKSEYNRRSQEQGAANASFMLTGNNDQELYRVIYAIENGGKTPEGADYIFSDKDMTLAAVSSAYNYLTKKDGTNANTVAAFEASDAKPKFYINEEDEALLRGLKDGSVVAQEPISTESIAISAMANAVDLVARATQKTENPEGITAADEFFANASIFTVGDASSQPEGAFKTIATRKEPAQAKLQQKDDRLSAEAERQRVEQLVGDSMESMTTDLYSMTPDGATTLEYGDTENSDYFFNAKTAVLEATNGTIGYGQENNTDIASARLEPEEHWLKDVSPLSNLPLQYVSEINPGKINPQTPYEYAIQNLPAIGITGYGNDIDKATVNRINEIIDTQNRFEDGSVTDEQKEWRIAKNTSNYIYNSELAKIAEQLKDTGFTGEAQTPEQAELLETAKRAYVSEAQQSAAIRAQYTGEHINAWVQGVVGGVLDTAKDTIAGLPLMAYNIAKTGTPTAIDTQGADEWIQSVYQPYNDAKVQRSVDYQNSKYQSELTDTAGGVAAAATYMMMMYAGGTIGGAAGGGATAGGTAATATSAGGKILGFLKGAAVNLTTPQQLTGLTINLSQRSLESAANGDLSEGVFLENLIKSVVDVKIEAMGGLFGKAGSGQLDNKLIGQAFAKMKGKGTLATTALNLLDTTAHEIGEELLQNSTDKLITKAFHSDRDIPWTGDGGVIDPKEMLQTLTVTSIATTMFGLAGMPDTYSSSKKANQAIAAYNSFAKSATTDFKNNVKTSEQTQLHFDKFLDLAQQAVMDFNANVDAGTLRTIEAGLTSDVSEQLEYAKNKYKSEFKGLMDAVVEGAAGGNEDFTQLIEEQQTKVLTAQDEYVAQLTGSTERTLAQVMINDPVLSNLSQGDTEMAEFLNSLPSDPNDPQAVYSSYKANAAKEYAMQHENNPYTFAQLDGSYNDVKKLNRRLSNRVGEVSKQLSMQRDAVSELSSSDEQAAQFQELVNMNAEVLTLKAQIKAADETQRATFEQKLSSLKMEIDDATVKAGLSNQQAQQEILAAKNPEDVKAAVKKAADTKAKLQGIKERFEEVSLKKQAYEDWTDFKNEMSALGDSVTTRSVQHQLAAEGLDLTTEQGLRRTAELIAKEQTWLMRNKENYAQISGDFASKETYDIHFDKAKKDKARGLTDEMRQHRAQTDARRAAETSFLDTANLIDEYTVNPEGFKKARQLDKAVKGLIKNIGAGDIRTVIHNLTPNSVMAENFTRNLDGAFESALRNQDIKDATPAVNAFNALADAYNGVLFRIEQATNNQQSATEVMQQLTGVQKRASQSTDAYLRGLQNQKGFTKNAKGLRTILSKTLGYNAQTLSTFCYSLDKGPAGAMTEHVYAPIQQAEHKYTNLFYEEYDLLFNLAGLDGKTRPARAKQFESDSKHLTRTPVTLTTKKGDIKISAAVAMNLESDIEHGIIAESNRVEIKDMSEKKTYKLYGEDFIGKKAKYKITVDNDTRAMMDKYKAVFDAMNNQTYINGKPTLKALHDLNARENYGYMHGVKDDYQRRIASHKGDLADMFSSSKDKASASSEMRTQGSDTSQTIFVHNAFEAHATHMQSVIHGYAFDGAKIKFRDLFFNEQIGHDFASGDYLSAFKEEKSGSGNIQGLEILGYTHGQTAEHAMQSLNNALNPGMRQSIFGNRGVDKVFKNVLASHISIFSGKTTVFLNNVGSLAAALSELDIRSTAGLLPGTLSKRPSGELMRQFNGTFSTRYEQGFSPETYQAKADSAKIRELGLKPSEAFDKLTTLTVYRMVAREVKSKNPNLTGQEYWDAVNYRALDIVDKTQPGFNLLSRPLGSLAHWDKNQSLGVPSKLFYQYSSATSQLANIAMRGVIDLKNGDIKGGAKKITAFLASNMLAAAVTKWLAGRNPKEEKEITTQDLMSAAGLGCFLGVRDIISTIEFGFDVAGAKELDGLAEGVKQVIEKSAEASKLRDAIEKATDENEKSKLQKKLDAAISAAWRQSAGAIGLTGDLFGGFNLDTLVDRAFRYIGWVSPSLQDEYLNIRGKSVSAKTHYERLEKALKSNDSAGILESMKYLAKEGKDADDIYKHLTKDDYKHEGLKIDKIRFEQFYANATTGIQMNTERLESIPSASKEDIINYVKESK